ncbi:alpha/beta hydrolase [Actinoplanes sp. URMC 104]|uniref:alpha/beta hydrolase n=1 Tax=Actinoplanes sp. URMC 104 TaxID=3423409 RepID=UPI003F19D0D0
MSRGSGQAGRGRLGVRLGATPSATGPTGTMPIEDTDGGLLALVFVPQPAGGTAYRLVVSLHGAGGSARHGLGLLLPVAAEQGLLIVAPQSSGSSWDMIHGRFGPDVRRLDRVLTGILEQYPVDRMAIGGFSDGASYALSLGMANGDLFEAVLAFSPGFAAPQVRTGEPRIFVSHGTADRVLPIDRCSRRLVPRLQAMGYDVTYEEFAGGHEVPAHLVRQAAAWLPA